MASRSSPVPSPLPSCPVTSTDAHHDFLNFLTIASLVALVLSTLVIVKANKIKFQMMKENFDDLVKGLLLFLVCTGAPILLAHKSLFLASLYLFMCVVGVALEIYNLYTEMTNADAHVFYRQPNSVGKRVRFIGLKHLLDVLHPVCSLIFAIMTLMNVIRKDFVKFEVVTIVQAVLSVLSGNKIMVGFMMGIGRFARIKHDGTLTRVRKVTEVPFYKYECVFEDIPRGWKEALDSIRNGSSAQAIEGMKIVYKLLPDADGNRLDSMVYNDADSLFSGLSTRVRNAIDTNLIKLSSTSSSRTSRYVLKTLSKTFESKLLAQSITVNVLEELISSLLTWALHPNFHMLQSSDKLKEALNSLMIQIMRNSKTESALLILTDMVCLPDLQLDPRLEDLVIGYLAAWSEIEIDFPDPNNLQELMTHLTENQKRKMADKLHYEVRGGDVDTKKKIEYLKKSLKEKEIQIANLKELNEALSIKERKTNSDLKFAQKVLIDGMKAMPGLKEMGGDVDYDKILNASSIGDCVKLLLQLSDDNKR